MIKYQIRTNAGEILQLLDKKGEATLSEIQEQLKLREQEIYLALGWMACDNKVFLFQNGQRLRVVIFD